jgi:hypothetical protein
MNRRNRNQADVEYDFDPELDTPYFFDRHDVEGNAEHWEERTPDIARWIDENATWLQEEPRKTLDIVLRLHPNTIRRMKDALEYLDSIDGYLYDAGYTPEGDLHYTQIWHWAEGKSFPTNV